MRGVGAFAWLLVAALAGANEVCIDKQTGALSSGHFVVDPAPHSPKGQNCYSIHPPTKPARGFLDPMRIWDFATSQPWYNYCLLAWILSAVEKYFE